MGETIYSDVTVRGTNYRLDNCRAVFKFAHKYQHKKGIKTSVVCKNEPTDEDPYPQAVYIALEYPGIWGVNARLYHVGYLPRKMAYALRPERLRERGIDGFTLELVDADYDPDEDYPFEFIVDVIAA